MVNRYATQAGRKYQRDVMKYLRDDLGLDAESLVLAGAEDEGDVLLRMAMDPLGAHRFVIECKREKGFNLAGWVKQAQVEADNYRKHRTKSDGYPAFKMPGFLVVHHARNKGIGQSYVTTTLDEWVRQVVT